jgi:hypothetical protein
VHLSELISTIDAVAKAQAVQVYVEVLAKTGKRQARPLPQGGVLVDAEDDLPE